MAPDEFDRMPADLRSQLLTAGVDSLSTIAAVWRRIPPSDTLDTMGERKELVDFEDIYLLKLRDHVDPCDAIDQLSQSPHVLVAQCDHYFEPFSFPSDPPNDPDYVSQWHLNNTAQIAAGLPCDPAIDINAPQAWQISNLAGSPIAIIDSGVSQTNPELAPFVAPFPVSHNFSTTDPTDWGGDGHGTNVAGVAAARGNNGLQVAGVSNIGVADPSPLLVSLRVACSSCFPDGGWTVSRVVSALAHLAGYPEVRISNHSYGDNTNSWKTCWDNVALRTAFRNSYFSNNCMVVASGNGTACTGSGCNPFGPDSCLAFPAAYEDFCLATTAVDCRGGKIDPNQQKGGFIDLAAPGGDAGTIWTTGLNGSTNLFGQTSAAAPMAAGTAALMLGANSSLTNDDLYGILAHSTSSLFFYGLGSVDVGSGLLRADEALKVLRWPYAVSIGTLTGVASTSATDLGEDVLTLRNVPGTGAPPEARVSYRARKYRVTWTGNLKNPLSVPVTFQYAWNRGRVTVGADDIDAGRAKRLDHLAEAGHADLLSLAPSGAATFQTFTYKISDATTGAFLCWYPFKPNVSDPETCSSSSTFKIGYGAIYKVAEWQNGEAAPGTPSLSLLPLLVAWVEDGRLRARLSLGAEVDVSLVLYDVTGRRVAELCSNKAMPRGLSELSWPIGDLVEARGVYLLSVSTGPDPRGSYAGAYTRRVVVGSR